MENKLNKLSQQDKSSKFCMDAGFLPLFVPASSLMKTSTLSTDDLAQEDLLQKYQGRVEGYHNKIVWLNFVLIQDSWLLLKSDSTSWRKTLKNSHNSQMQWPVVSTLFQETKIYLNRRVGSEETPNLVPYWKLQPVAFKVNTELRLELCLWTWPEQIGHGLEQQRTGNLRNAVRRICFETECKWFCKPIKDKSKNTKTWFCQLIHKIYTYWGERT